MQQPQAISPRNRPRYCNQGEKRRRKRFKSSPHGKAQRSYTVNNGVIKCLVRIQTYTNTPLRHATSQPI
jgi:hypothetical protein